MKALVFVALLISTQLGLGAVIVFAPPTPLFTTEEVNPTSFAVDIDNNGTDDFQFGGSIIRGTLFRTERANRAIMTLTVPPNASGSSVPLLENVLVGPSAPSGLAWSSSSPDGYSEPGILGGTFDTLVSCLSTGCEGLFYSPDGLRALLGVEFEAGDGLHYGYFDLDFGVGGLSAQIRGWAYESEPNMPITTTFIPEPSSVVLIVSAVLAFVGTRRRRVEIPSGPSNC